MMAVKRKTIHNLVWQKLVPIYRRDVYTVVLGLVTGYLGLVTLLLQITPGLVPVFSNCTPLINQKKINFL